MLSTGLLWGAFLASLATATNVARFQQGVDGYTGTVDTELWEVSPTTNLSKNETLTSDADNGGGESHGLLRFKGLFGEKSGQVPRGARIISAKLTVVAFDPGTTVSLCRMLVAWDDSATWNSMVRGVSADGLEAQRLREGFTFGAIVMDKQEVTFDVTGSVQSWSDGAPNHGWVFLNQSSDGWDFYTSESAETSLRPKLTIEFERPRD